MDNFFCDRVTANGVRRTSDGYLVAQAPVARTGVQLYRGAELGMNDRQFVRVYRPEAEVFSDASMQSYAHRPMTNDHPGVLVDSDNWSDFAVGQTGDEIVRDGQTVRVPLVLMDQKAINDFENGKRELSMGYTADLEVLDEAGVTEDGQEYDAIQRNMRMNHLALVQKGRAGNARIGDGRDPHNTAHTQTGGHTMPDTLKKVVVDGLTIETTEQGAQALEKVAKQLDDATTANAQLQATHDTAVTDHAREIAAKDAEIEKLKGEQLTDAQMAEAVAARTELVNNAKRIHDKGEYDQLSAEDIRKTALAGKFGDSAIEGKAQAYIDARFDIEVENLGSNDGDQGVRDALRHNDGGVQLSDADKAYADNLNYLETAHLDGKHPQAPTVGAQ